MNLTTGKLLWPDTMPDPPAYPRLEDDIECECIVIGGGEAGAIISYTLYNRGVDTVVVDKRRIASGTVSASTGLLQWMNDTPLLSMIHSFGEETAVRFYKLCEQAVQQIGLVARQLDFSPDFICRNSLCYASSADDVPKLKQEYEALAKHGFPVQYLEAESIAARYSIRKPGAILSQADAELNPYKYANALIRTAHRQGMRVFQETEVLRHQTGKDHIVFYTNDNRRIKARKAVFATGFETMEIIRHPNTVFTSSYVVATQPLDGFPRWPNRCLIWETARPYVYIRTTADNRIVIGGKDEDTSGPEERKQHLSSKRDQLLQTVQELFPEAGSIQAEYAWSAAYGRTRDGLPMIGAMEQFPHCYFAMVYGGNGTVYSMIAAQMIAGLITEGRHPDADLVRIDRPAHSLETPV